MALLPDPKGRDEGHEAVEIGNSTDKPVDLAGWKLRDRAGNAYRLTGTVAAKGRLRIVMNPPTMPLNNDGDEVVLLDAAGVAVSRATYTEHQVLAKSWNLRRKGGRTTTPRIAAAVAEIHNGTRRDPLKMPPPSRGPASGREMIFPVESLVRRPGTQGGDAKRWTRYNSSSGV